MKNRKLLGRLVLATVAGSAFMGGGFSVHDSSRDGNFITFAPRVAYADNNVLDRAEERIEKAFKSDSILRRYDLDVDEEGDNRIEIEGVVRTNAERERAYKIARSHTPRRYRVVNKIRVQGRA